MAVHALNLVDPSNWRREVIRTAAGEKEGWHYVSPETEVSHLTALQDGSRDRQTNAAMEAHVKLALNDPTRSSPAFAETALNWARGNAAQQGDLDETQQWIRREAIITAAVIAARDGTAHLISSNVDWMRETFQRALQGEHDPAHRMRAGLQYNPFAVAFVGLTLLLRNCFDMADVRKLLEAAADEDPAAARGFAAVASVLGEIDDRLPRSILRSAFVARSYARREWGVSDEEYASRQAGLRLDVERAVEAELTWLTEGGEEPAWPEFPPEPARSSYRFQRGSHWRDLDEELRNPRPHMDHHSAALWLSGAHSLFEVANRPWLRNILDRYVSWTFAANGSGLEAHDDIDHPPREWNEAYFKLAAACVVGLSYDDVRKTTIAPIASLPDDAFLDIAATFVRNLDDFYFNNRGVDDAQVAEIRAELATHTMASAVWHRHVRDRSDRIETHLGPAVAVLLFNEYSMVVPAKCYLLPKGIDRIERCLPTVRALAEAGTFLFVANVLLNLLEVAPQAAHLPVILCGAKAWLDAQPNSHGFWVDACIGQRVCVILDVIIRANAAAYGAAGSLKVEIDSLLASLVQLGVAEAHILEKSLRNQS